MPHPADGRWPERKVDIAEKYLDRMLGKLDPNEISDKKHINN